MILSRFFGRRDVRSIQRPSPRRRPSVESLDSRQLLSTLALPIQGAHIGVAAIQGAHIGSNAAIVGAHIGLAPSIQGAHIG